MLGQVPFFSVSLSFETVLNAVSMKAEVELEVCGKLKRVLSINMASLGEAYKSLTAPDTGSPCFCTWPSFQHSRID